MIDCRGTLLEPTADHQHFASVHRGCRVPAWIDANRPKPLEIAGVALPEPPGIRRVVDLVDSISVLLGPVARLVERPPLFLWSYESLSFESVSLLSLDLLGCSAHHLGAVLEHVDIAYELPRSLFGDLSCPGGSASGPREHLIDRLDGVDHSFGERLLGRDESALAKAFSYGFLAGISAPGHAPHKGIVSVIDQSL